MADESRRSSPWPVFVALGIVTTEAGVLFALLPVAVGGVVVFGASCAGMAHEVGYATDRWTPLRAIGAIIAIGSVAIWVAIARTPTPAALANAATTHGVAVRAAIVLVGAILLLAAGIVGPLITGRSGGTS